VGSVVLPDSALVEEGTSAHYLAPHVRTEPSTALVEALRLGLTEAGVRPFLGRVWTTDAVFRETRGKVLRYQRDGVLAVDMESSALMTVASFRGVDLACAMVVSDELGSLRWHRGFHTQAFTETLQKVVGVAALCLGRWLGAREEL